MKSILNFLVALVFVFFLILIGLMPFTFLYLFSDLVYFVLFRVTKYRRAVMEENLRISFREHSEAEIQSMLRKAYRNLSDILVEGLKAFTMGHRQVAKRHRLLNPELAEVFLDQGRSIIIVTGHYANWEWGTLSAGVFFHNQTIALYKSMSNGWIDKMVRWNRHRCGTMLVSIRETSLTFAKYRNLPSLFLMVADQNPYSTRGCYWIDFLGRDTAFLYGPEKHARLSDCPVLYVDVQRVRRGYYELRLELLTDQPRLLPDGEITRRYVKKLESVILRKPEDWLWSHRRWKRTRILPLTLSSI